MMLRTMQELRKRRLRVPRSSTPIIVTGIVVFVNGEPEVVMRDDGRTVWKRDADR